MKGLLTSFDTKLWASDAATLFPKGLVSVGTAMAHRGGGQMSSRFQPKSNVNTNHYTLLLCREPSNPTIQDWGGSVVEGLAAGAQESKKL